MRPFILIVLLILAISTHPAVSFAQEQDITKPHALSVDDVHKLTEKAEKGDADVQQRLGLMYSTGWGVPQDYTEALKWYRKAAEQGKAFSQSGLATMYFSGWGVPQDYTEAVKWYRKAAEQGDLGGQDGLGTMYVKGLGVPQDYNEGAKWVLKAAEQGLSADQLKLAAMYSLGHGVPQDYEEAYAWSSVAAAPGNRDAATLRDEVAQKLTPDALLKAQQLSKRYFADYVKHPSAAAP